MRCVSVALVDQKDKYHEGSGTAATALFFTISYRCHAMNWEHCLAYSCFTMNRKDLFHILTVQVALETEVLTLMSQEERQCELSVLYLWQPDSKACLVLSGRLSWLADARLGLCSFCSVSLCLYPWILLSLLCYPWMRIWDVNLSFISSVRPCLEKCFHISCWPFPRNNNSSGSWNVRYQLVIPWGKAPSSFSL